MRRDLRILLVTVSVGALVAWGDRLPESLATMETFRIDEVEVRGIRYLSRETVFELLGLTPETSVWSDEAVWTERVAAHPLVRDVRVLRRFPNGLLVVVDEREPIALAPTPILEPVDAQGYRLPIDPAAHRLDLPVISTDLVPPPGSRLFPEDVRLLASELNHLMGSDTAFLQMVSSIARIERGAVVARWTDPRVDFLLPPRASPARLREGLGALADAASRAPGGVPSQVDLRFADQVVVRRTREN